jgi:FkbH-like protein
MNVEPSGDRPARVWARRDGESLGDYLGRGARVLGQLASAPARLRACDRVGRRPRTAGAPRIVNAGRIEIGDDVVLLSQWSPVELVTGRGGRLEIGNGVHINFGTLICAHAAVRLSDGVQIGQYVVVADTDGPAGDEPGPGEARPIEIGSGAWLAGRVTVLPGARIGAGAVITAGSVVEGEIPADVVAGGIPARVLRRVGGLPPAPAPFEAMPAPAAPDRTPVARGTLIADFTIDPMVRFLADAAEGPVLAASVAPFGQVTQTLLQGPSPDDSGFAVVWTRPETAVPVFARVLGHEQVREEELREQVDAFCSLVAQGARAWRQVFVPSWTLPADRRGLGVLEGRQGAIRELAAMNVRLMERLAATGNVYVLDAQRWMASAGRAGQSPRGWFLGKVAFGDAVLSEAARDVQAAVAGLLGGARKLLILDLDDTLWGGIVGDVGWQGLRLGGHDPIGEAFAAFQSDLKALSRRGVVLAIVSKNEEATAREAIRSHPEMVLREDDFVGWRINWRDKAHNIADLCAELNLGLQSTVFIDDNPIERARVREALPEVLVPEWPDDKLLYPGALGMLRCFDAPSLSAEDTERTQLYASERKRDSHRVEVGSLDDWLSKLDTRVRVEPLGPVNLARTAQLFNKTNQMNLSTRRLTEQELLDWTRGSGRQLWTVTVSDRFGDAGLTGIVSLEAAGEVGRIVDYILSCRVMGRRVEEAMVHVVVETARQARFRTVEARLLPTAKNKPCLDFWLRSGFETRESGLFRWDASRPFDLPGCIHLDWRRD